jgi:uncharacterized protein
VRIIRTRRAKSRARCHSAYMIIIYAWMIDLAKITSFDWDEGNARKNERHGVSMAEAEQVFFSAPLLLLADPRHSDSEPRFHALGKTAENRRLHVVFTLRQAGKAIRVISARDMSRKERATYAQASKKHS